MLTFTFTYENGSRHGEGDRRESYIFIRGVPILVSVSVSEPIPLVSVSDRYR